MDAHRTSFVLIIAALLAGTALAEPPSQSGPMRGANPWSSTGPKSIPTISASSTDRYGNPQYAYPPGTQPQSVTQQIQSAGQQISTAATSASQQTFGTAGYPAQSSNPFATQPAAPPANSTSRNLAPPPWPTGTGTPAPPATSSWGTSTPATPVDRSVLANPAPPQSSSGWTSIGSTIAAPPMLLPQLPTTASSLTPFNTTPIDSGPSFTTDSYRGGQPSSNSSTSSTNWAQQPFSPSSARSTSPADDAAAAWDASASSSNRNGASIGRNANNSSPQSTSRDLEFPSSPRLGSNTQDVRSTVAKPADSFDSWSRNSQSPQNGVDASIGASKAAGIGSASNSAPVIQSPINAPPLSPPAINSAGNNMNFGGTASNAPQQPITGNAGKTTLAATATGEPQPWVTLLAAILGLAGSLAGNVYLGWSYLDARQKYQALVRRTADTFRRTKVAA